MNILKALISGSIAMGLMVSVVPPKPAEAGVFKKALTIGAGVLAYHEAKKYLDYHTNEQPPQHYSRNGEAIPVHSGTTQMQEQTTQVPNIFGNTNSAPVTAQPTQLTQGPNSSNGVFRFDTTPHPAPKYVEPQNAETMTPDELIAQSKNGGHYNNAQEALATVVQAPVCNNPTYRYNDKTQKCEKTKDSYGDINDPNPRRPSLN